MIIYNKNKRVVNKQNKPKEKKCMTCNIFKNINEFSERGRVCFSCRKKRSSVNYQKNKQQILLKNKRWRENKNNLSKIKIYRKKSNKKRNLMQAISCRINFCLKKIFKCKSNKTTKTIIGYSSKELKEHLEKQFEPWMNWNNWGKYNIKTWNDNNSETWTWNIDHIIPVSTFDFTDEKQIKKCWALENLRPLSAKQNIMDGNRRLYN
jgi:hypothetical protein